MVRTRIPWVEEELEIVRRAYPHNQTEKIARVLRRPLSSVYRIASDLGLKKSPAYLATAEACRLRRDSSVGVPYRFPKGHVPANKGLRRPGWHAGRMRQTQFQKGRKPQTWLPIGTRVRDPDGFWKRKVRDDAPSGQSRFNWVYEHIALWEEHLGRVPPRHVVLFKNGNRDDVRCDNLACISQRANMLRNTLHRFPKQIVQLIQLRGTLNRAINRRRRHSEKQDE